MLVDDGLLLPKGYGFRRMPLVELRERTNLFDTLLIWEGPRRHGPRRYVIAVDVSDGLGQDRSVIEVARMGTIEEPAEQVAQYVSDQIAPMALAYVIQAIGQYYVDEDGVEALVAIECNNHGLSTQDTLQLHLGYQTSPCASRSIATRAITRRSGAGKSCRTTSSWNRPIA